MEGGRGGSLKGAGKTTADLVISQHHAREREGVSSLRGLLVETESEGGGGRKRKADKICDSCVHKLHGYDDFILVFLVVLCWIQSSR